jgi:hypothetical protein
MTNPNSSKNNCLYRILQCEGKEIQIYIHSCCMISLSVLKCVVYRELKMWLRLEEIIFLCVRTRIVMDCFYRVGCGVSNTQFLEILLEAFVYTQQTASLQLMTARLPRISNPITVHMLHCVLGHRKF